MKVSVLVIVSCDIVLIALDQI